MKKENEKYYHISKQTDLEDLIETIDKGTLLAKEFKFAERDFFIKLLESLNIDYEKFSQTYYHFDKSRNLHISESEFGYVWISTYGLIARDKSTNDKNVNACSNQYTVISLLLDKAIEISKSSKVYDVDGYNFGLLNDLSPALFHNLLFYVEVFSKAYLSLSGVDYPHTHKLSIIYSKLINTMFDKGHNDSLFHIQIAEQFSKIVQYVTTIPGNFKEQFVKYDDNEEDSTVIIFQPEYLHEIKTMTELCQDFILDYFYTGEKSHYLKSGFLKKVLDRAKTEEQKKKISEMYKHLIIKE